MSILDPVRPYLVGNSLYNSVVTTLLALPFTLVWGWLLKALIEQVAGKRRLQVLLALALNLLLSLANFWLLPKLAAYFALRFSLPGTALLIGLVPALAWAIAPTVALVALLNRPLPRLWPEVPIDASWQTFLTVLISTLTLLFCNCTVPLLLSGGRPFNATHTLASWIFAQAWINGNYGQMLMLAALLSASLLFLSLLPFGVERSVAWRWDKQKIRLLLLVSIPGFLIAIPAIFRTVGWVDGREPLFIADFFAVSGIVLTRSGLKAIANSMHRDKPTGMRGVNL